MRRIARVAGLLVAVLLLIILALPFLIDANSFRPMLEAELSSALARTVKIGDLKLALVSGGVTASDLSIADDPAFRQDWFLRAKSFHLGVELVPLVFHRKLNVTGLMIEQPEIVLVQNPAGLWNFSSLGARSGPKTTAGSGLDLSVKQVKISGGRLTFGPRVLDALNISVQDFSATAAFPFKISARAAGGGDVRLEGKAGPLATSNDAGTPFHATLAIDHFDLTTPGLDGIMTFAGDAGSDGKSVDFTGRMKIEKLKVNPAGSPAARAVTLDCAIRHELTTRAGEIRRGDIQIGKAAASLLGTYQLADPTPSVKLTLAGSGMPLVELAAMMPAFHIALPAGASIESGAATVQMASEGRTDRLVSSGSVNVQNARIAGFDLGAKMSTVERLAGIKTGPTTEIQVLSANVKAGPSGTQIDQLKLVAPSIGELSGDGSISPDQALDFKMRATLHTAGVVMTALGAKGDLGVPFSVQGTASNPIFKPDVKGMVSSELKKSGASEAKGLLDRLFRKH